MGTPSENSDVQTNQDIPKKKKKKERPQEQDSDLAAVVDVPVAIDEVPPKRNQKKLSEGTLMADQTSEINGGRQANKEKKKRKSIEEHLIGTLMADQTSEI